MARQDDRWNALLQDQDPEQAATTAEALLNQGPVPLTAAQGAATVLGRLVSQGELRLPLSSLLAPSTGGLVGAIRRLLRPTPGLVFASLTAEQRLESTGTLLASLIGMASAAPEVLVGGPWSRWRNIPPGRS